MSSHQNLKLNTDWLLVYPPLGHLGQHLYPTILTLVVALYHMPYPHVLDPAVAEDIDQQINEDSTVDVAASSKQDDDGPETERENKLQEIRLKLLEGLMERLSQLETVGGLRSIPFLQVK